MGCQVSSGHEPDWGGVLMAKGTRYVKLWQIDNGDPDLHEAIVHAYYHLLQSERGYRFAEAGKLIGGYDETVENWENESVGHFIAYLEQLAMIPWIEDYLRFRQEMRIERRAKAMWRDKGDNRKSFKEVEARKRRRDRRNSAKWN